MKLKQVLLVLVGLAVLSPNCSPAQAGETTDDLSLARQFTAQCLADENVFVYNPPTDRNPYKDMSRQELEKLQRHAMQGGSILFLYLDGLPAKFESRRNYKEHGLQQTWYPDGRSRSVERYEDGKLLDGTYLDRSGAVLSTITEGTGSKTIFSDPLEQRGESVRGFVDYVLGVKDGVEILYSDYPKKLKAAESHYRAGKLHGVRTQWMLSGEKNSEESYRDGRQHGRSTFWYKNGTVQSTAEYVDGARVGQWTRYYETGVKAQEVSSNEVAQWYPSGQLMVRKTPGDQGNVVSGSSFDSLGNRTGSVVDGSGSLIEGEEIERHGLYRLSVFTRDRPYQSMLLPRPRVSFGYGHTDLDLTLTLEALDKDLQDLRLALLLPPDCLSPNTLTLAADHLPAGRSTQLGPVAIKLPEPATTWSGAIFIDVQAVVAGIPVRYQHTVTDELRSLREVAARPFQQEKKPVPRRELPWYVGNKRPAPIVDGKALPPFELAADYWRLGETAWVLYKTPALLIVSNDRGLTWQAARSDFPYRPCGLYVRSENDVLVWGTRPTADVSRGIPSVVEQSRDGCKSWAPVAIPRVDFLLSFGGSEGRLMISGIRMPKGGIPPDKDWFELPHTLFLTQDGTNYSEIVGPSFFDIESIKTKSVAPNKQFRAFLSVSSWLDTSYGLYLAESKDGVPVLRLHPSAAGEIIWSANSRILTISVLGRFIAYFDSATGDSAQIGYPYDNGASDRQKAELSALDTKVRSLLDANRE